MITNLHKSTKYLTLLIVTAILIPIAAGILLHRPLHTAPKVNFDHGVNTQVMGTGIATFSNNPNANTGISLSGGLGPSSNTLQIGANPAQNSATTSNQYLIAPSASSSNGVVQGAATVTPGGPAAAGAGTGTDLSSYDQSINNTQAAIDRLPGQLNSGNSTIDASYTNAINQLMAGENQATSTYNTNKHQTATDFVTAKNTIGANAGASLEGLQRLLGSKGAGGSSAYNIVAPEDVARQATLQRNDATSTFGDNNQTLDTNFGNYKIGVDNQVSSAANQRDQQKQQEQQTIDGNRATLLQSLATLVGQRAQAAGGNPVAAAQPDLDQANAILNGLSNYTTAPIAYNTSAYTAPSLASYTTTPNAAPVAGGSAPGSDYVSPFLSALLGKKLQTA